MSNQKIQPRKVLLAEENPKTLADLARLLRGEGYDILEVADGLQALRHLERGLVEVALLDLDLPTLSGLEILQDANQKGLRMPIILTTHSWNIKRAVAAMKDGARDYLTKPFNLPEVLAALQGVFHQAAAAKTQTPVPRPEQLEQAQKMEAVGRLASGVVHDFNNLLTVIMGYGDILKVNLASTHPLRPCAEEIAKAAEQGAALIQQLLAFSRKQVIEPRLLNVNDVINRMDSILRRLLGRHVTFQTELAADLGTVRADPTQMVQVLMNLTVNARDAMTSPGQLLLKTSNCDIKPDITAPASEEHPIASAGGQPPGEQPVPPGSYVVLSVTDTGCGMDEHTLAHLFEPFFTTKPSGQGTGLGLSTVHNIVQQSGGHITVNSAPGRGSTFSIYLPLVHETPIDLSAGPSAHPQLRGSETLLLMEDEPALRALIRRVLDLHGYKVIEVSSAVEAEHFCTTYPGPVHLLITDLLLPHLVGLTLARRLTRLRPSLQVLYITGHSNNALVQQILHEGQAAVLQKPFSPETLLSKIREALEKGLVMV